MSEQDPFITLYAERRVVLNAKRTECKVSGFVKAIMVMQMIMITVYFLCTGFYITQPHVII